MGLLAWIIFGAAAGWVASILMGRNQAQGWIGNIVVGMVGALIGGLLWSLVDDDGSTMDWSIGSFLIAVGGSVVLLALYSLFTSRKV